MKTIFKKTLVAAALTAAAFNASAVTVTATPLQVSQEGAAKETSITVPNIAALAGAEYTVGDTITLTFTGAELDLDTSAPAMTVAFGDNDAATIGFVGATANSVTFRITAQTDGAADPGVNYAGDATFTATGLEFKTSTVVDATGAITVQHSAANVTGTIILDNLGTRTATVANVLSQFSSTVTTKLNETIDVSNGRQKFVGATTDTLIVTPVEAAAADFDAVYKSAAIKVKGDFSFADLNKDGTVSAPELAASVAVTSGDAGDTVSVGALNADKNEYSVTVTDTDADGVAAYTVTITEPKTADAAATSVLAPGSYTVDTTLTYDTATTTAPAALPTKATGVGQDGGAWDLNGSTVQVPYMVFGTVGPKAYNTILVVNNASEIAGDVYVDVWAEDGTVILTNKKVATAAANSATNIGAAVKAELDALSKGNGKVSLRIVSNTPAEKTAVYSAFVDTVTGERVIINNDSSVQTK